MTKVTKNQVTIKNVMKEILSQEDFINVNELITRVSKITGYSKESVRGSSLGSTDKFMSDKWFFENYVYYPQKKGKQPIIFKKSFLNDVNTYHDKKPITISYNSKEKELARKYIFNVIENTQNPKILTFASEEGLDVKFINKLNNTAKIHNIERDVEILERYKKLKLKTTNFNMTLNTFLKKRKNFQKYDLINYDTVGYLCKYISDDLKLINDYKKTEYLFLTMSNIKKIRNYGEFAEFVRNKYKDYDDPTLSYIKDIMYNYDFISEYTYKQPNVKKGMRILQFKIK